MRQASGTDHQCHCDAEDINAALRTCRVLIEAQRCDDVIELVE